MTTRERHYREPEASLPASAETENPDEAGPRETGDAFLAAADAALERALSGTPEEFLAQNRQLGGE